MLIKAFHASPVRIKEFEIPYAGLHFGDLSAALQAVERKLEYSNTDTFYLHEVVLDISNVEDVFDSGNDWRDDLDGDTSKVFSYTNKYEPSSGKSYVMFDTKFIKKVVKVSKESLIAYEDELNKLF